MTSKDVKMFYNQAMEEFRKGQFEKALDMLDTILRIDKKFAPAWNSKGVALLEMEDYPQALNCFERVIKLNAADNLAWYNKAYVLSLMEKYAESVKTFDFFRARYENKEDDFYKYALYLQAQGYFHLQEYENSLELVEAALKLDKKFSEAQELKESLSKKMKTV